MKLSQIQKKTARHKRVRAKIAGTAQRPRLSVFRSNRHIYAQLIDDSAGRTILQFNDLELGKKSKSAKKIDTAEIVGRNLGELILKNGFKQVVFDRGSYRYHGRVKSLAEGLRKAGVKL